MAYQYSVTIHNQAMSADYLMLYQNNPGTWSPNALAVAWFSKFSNPKSTITFNWTVDYGVSWADTGTLAPGVTFQSSEIEEVSPTSNQWTLDYNGGYFFSNPQKGQDSSRIYVQESGNIPVASSASVGMTMSGSTVFAVQAQPNLNLTGSPHPTYFLAYGNYMPGQVIDVSEINNPVELLYPTGVYSLETTLNADNSWTPPTPVSSANAQRLKLLSR